MRELAQSLKKDLDKLASPIKVRPRRRRKRRNKKHYKQIEEGIKEEDDEEGSGDDHGHARTRLRKHKTPVMPGTSTLNTDQFELQTTENQKINNKDDENSKEDN